VVKCWGGKAGGRAENRPKPSFVIEGLWKVLQRRSPKSRNLSWWPKKEREGGLGYFLGGECNRGSHGPKRGDNVGEGIRGVSKQEMGNKFR